MKRGTVIALVVILVLLLAGIFFLGKRITGNVSLSFEDTLKINQQITGNLIIKIEQGDSIEENTPIIVSLFEKKTLGEDVIEAETLTFKEFIQMSDNPISLVTHDGKNFYETPGTYQVETKRIIKSPVLRSGEYELYFKIFNPDITIQKYFLVE